MLPLLISLIAVGAADNPPVSEVLRLKLSTAAQIQVGEPTKLTVEWTATRALAVVTAEAEVWLDGGRGFERYQETRLGTASTVYFDETLKPGQTLVSEYVLAVSGYPDVSNFSLAFPRPGRYQAQVRYKNAMSNAATINVTAPKGKDADLLEHLRRRPELLSQWGLIEDFAGDALERLLGEYRGSRYLSRSQVLFWKKKLDGARAADQHAGMKLSEGETARLLEEVAANEFEDTSFEEDRLLLVAETSAAIGNRAKARGHYEKIISNYPKSHCAVVSQRWIAEEDAAAERERAAARQNP